MKEDLASRIAAAKLHLNTVLLEGGNTADARAALKKLQDEQVAIVAAQAQQEADAQAAQQGLGQIVSQRINDAAQTLAEARHARISCLSERFRIPDIRSSATA